MADTPLDKTLPATARRLLTTYGTDATLVINYLPTYARNTGQVSGAIRIELPSKIVPPDTFDGKYAPEDVTPEGDLETYMAVFYVLGIAVLPVPGDIIETSTGVEYLVVRSDLILSGNQVAAIRLDLKNP
jgi:hypothetical protein